MQRSQGGMCLTCLGVREATKAEGSELRGVIAGAEVRTNEQGVKIVSCA